MEVAPLHWLDQQSDSVRTDLLTISNMNSGTSNRDGLEKVAEWIEHWLDIPSATFKRLPLPSRQEIDDFGNEIRVESVDALRWDCRPNAARRVLLAIHYDTVFGSDHSFQSCRDISEDRISGPGVADAKGGVLVIRNALKAIEQFQLCEDCGWTILLNPDEEIGSPHSAKLFNEIADEFDFGMLFEPALPGGQLVSTRKGSGNYTVAVHGVAAHAGRHFHDGKNAIVKLCQLLSDLDALNGQRAGYTLNIGAIHGGGPVNIVPDTAVGRFNIRVDTLEHVQWIEQELKERLDTLNNLDGYSCMCVGKINSPPKTITNAMRQLMEAIEKSHAEVGLPPIQWVSTGGVCDGNKLAAAGLPNIDTLGPVGGGLHSSDEWVQTSSIIDKAKVVCHLLHQYSRSGANFRRMS